MIDNNAEVYTILSGVGTTFFQYPSTFAVFPCISYWDSGHSAIDFQDGLSGIDAIETTVDVWEKDDKTTGIVTEIHKQMDSAMRAAKFIRSYPVVSLYEADTHVYHYQSKYRKLYEEVD
jgi:hypothetical protein